MDQGRVYFKTDTENKVRKVLCRARLSYDITANLRRVF